jgi:XTP/dITP diphosphohydrolase
MKILKAFVIATCTLFSLAAYPNCYLGGAMTSDLDIKVLRFIKVNTSNVNKLKEFRNYLGSHVISEVADLDEPDSDPVTVIRYKASQFDKVIVDDTSLEVEGEKVGVNVKWMLNQLSNFVGKKAIFRCLLGIRSGNKVYVFKGEIQGTIVPKRGHSFGFLPYFQPDGSIKTLAEDLPDEFNARFFAVEDLIHNRPYLTCDVLPIWNGEFQSGSESESEQKGQCHEKSQNKSLVNLPTLPIGLR